MGLSIHYSGKIAEPGLLPKLIEEVKEIVSVFNWKWNVFEQQFPENSYDKSEINDNIYGISLTPPDCEPVFICFLSNGLMSSPIHLQFKINSTNQEEDEYLSMISTKTQYAGIKTHQFIIKLFRYLNTNYFSDFKMIDESGYWETNDEAVMKSNFKRYTDLMDGFALALETIHKNTDEDIEEYFERLLKQLSNKKKS